MKKSIAFMGSRHTVSVGSMVGGSLSKSIIVDEDSDSLEKGVVSDMFRYQSEKSDFSVSKKGSDIASSLSILSSAVDAKILSYESDLKEVEESLDVKPEAIVDEYVYDGMASILPTVKEYSWEQRSSKADEFRAMKRNGIQPSIVAGDSKDVYIDPYSDKDSDCYKMSKYNSLVRSIIQNKVEKRYIEAFSASLESGKTYKLPIKLAASLGIK